MNILLLSRYPEYMKIEDFLTSQGNNVIMRTDKIDLGFLKENKIDFMVSRCYGPIIKEPVISEYKHKIINIHVSFLPYGKGIYPNVWSFFEGTPNGVTLHFIDEGIDTGNIIFQKQVSFPDKHNETLRTTHAKLCIEVEKLFFDKWIDIINRNYTLTSQKDLVARGTYHNREESERLMALFPKGWDTPVLEVERLGKEFSLSPEKFWEKYGRR